MGAIYSLYNFTRGERVEFGQIGGGKAREMVWNGVPAAVATWYLLRHRGDLIAFLSDHDVDSQRELFGAVRTWPELRAFRDITEETIAHAVAARALEDHGVKWRDEADPTCAARDIRVASVEGPLPPEGLD